MAFASDGTAGTSLTTTYASSPPFSVGRRVGGTDQSEWLFIQASNSITQYDVIAIDENFKACQIATDAKAKESAVVGFAQVAIEKDYYAWVMIRGNPTIRVAADCEPDVPLYTTATAGVLDDAATSMMIQGLVASNSVSGATASVGAVANFPNIRRGVTL